MGSSTRNKNATSSVNLTSTESDSAAHQGRPSPGVTDGGSSTVSYSTISEGATSNHANDIVSEANGKRHRDGDAPEDAGLLTSYMLKEFDEPVINRVKTVIMLKDTTKHQYAFEQKPDCLEWGRTQNFDSNQTVLCVGNTNKVASFWFVGQLTSVYFIKQNEYVEKPSVGILPCSSGLGALAHKLMAELTMPKIDVDQPSTNIRASRWADKAKGDPGKYLPYSDIYDARKEFNANKNGMATLDATDLHIRDLVLIETTVRRYRTSASANSKGSSPSKLGPWMTWNTYFQMDSVSLIARSKGVPDEDLAGGTEFTF